MLPQPDRAVDLDLLAPHFDCRAESAYFFDREQGVARDASSLGLSGSGDDDSRPDPERYAAIQPLEYAQGLALIRGFMATPELARHRADLSRLLDGATPFVDFDLWLEREPPIRLAWRSYRDGALRTIARDWLRIHAPEWRPKPGMRGDTITLPMLPSGAASDVASSEYARRKRWHGAIWSQSIICGLALMSQMPIARWIWLSAVSVMTSAALVPLREALQCSAGNRSGMAWASAIAQATVGVGMTIFLVLLIPAMISTEFGNELSLLNSPILREFVWSDRHALPATISVLVTEVIVVLRFLPLLRRDLPNYRWSAGYEPILHGVAILVGIVIGATPAIALNAGWPMIVVMGACVLVIEYLFLSKLAPPVLRPEKRV